ncbi:MAG: B12-binding domain-containing radical SAM protein [Myxococcota bacterium]
MREKGVIIKQRGKNLHTAVLFPGRYNLAMSSLAYQSIYSFLNGLDGVLCDRFVQGIERSIEHGLTYMDYRAIFVTAPFILDIPELLRLCHKNLANKDYTRAVCIGGMAAVANPKLLSKCNAIIFPGELESHSEHIKSILNLIKSGAKREEIIEEIQPAASKVEMILPDRRELEYDPPTSVIYTKDTEFANMHLIEVSRGCTGNCNFCMSRHITRYYREFKFEHIVNAIDKAPPDIKIVGLIGDAVLSHSRIADIIEYILEKRRRPSFASIRIADLSPKKIPLILKSDIKTLTIAPEVATEKLMRVTNKFYNRTTLIEMLKELINGGVMNIKLYMMIGLPSETVEDIEAMIDLILDIREILIISSRKKGKVGKLRVSINNFVPSPTTPLAGKNPDTIENLQQKQVIISKKLSKYPNLSLSMMDIFETIYQTALFRADSSFADKIINMPDISPQKIFNEDNQFAKEILNLAFQNQ